jgi:putative sigma-54 modulation protein
VQTKISVRHGTLSEETQQTIRDKAARLLHFFERLTMIEVTVDMKLDIKKKETRSVKFLVQAEHKHDFVAHEESESVLTAVDAALANIEGQIRRYKEKIQDHRRDPSAADVAGPPATDAVGNE